MYKESEKINRPILILYDPAYNIMKIACFIFFILPVIASGQVIIGPSSGRDITSTLQSALNAGKSVHIASGEYSISSTITVPADVSITGSANTIITANATEGTLSTLMRFFLVYGSNATISHITFTGSEFKLDPYGLSAIYITGSRNVIDSNNFKFNFPYGDDVYAVWVSGRTANHNQITSNKCYTVGIQYAENAASYNLCKNNYIYKAGTDGLQGTGNNEDHIPCQGNRVIGNIVDRSGYSGVEEHKFVDSTLFEGNTFTNAGQAKVYLNSMGISVVGTNTIVKNNVVNGFGIYGIEIAGCSGLTIENNTVTNNTDTGALCMVNMLFAPKQGYTGTTYVINNKLTGGDMAIDLEGDNHVKLQIEENKILNPAWKGIYLETNSSDAVVSIKNNEITFSKPNSKQRAGINTYAKSPTRSHIRIEGNKITYLAGISKNKAGEIGILPGHSGTVVKDNIVKTAFPGVYSFSTNGDVIPFVTYINNTNIGGKVDLKSFTNKVEKGNNW